MIRPAGERRPRVSVIIATFNRARMLRCAIGSVLRQQENDLEVLVVGDHCTDESESVVASFADPRLTWLNREENCGSQSGPNNDGLARARGSLIAFLGHDDLWLPWHLETLLPLVEAGADLAHPIVALLGPDGLRRVIASTTISVPPSGWLVRRSVLERLGGFRDHRHLGRGTDDDLLQRLIKGGSRIAAAPRLSVLKFPSHWWQAYDAAAAIPQERWLAADPHATERDLLAQAVIGLSKESTHTTAFGRWIRDWLHRDDNLFAPLLRARFRRKRAALRRLRGL